MNSRNENTKELIYNGLILKGSNPDPRVLKYFNDILNLDIEIKDGYIKASVKPGMVSVNFVYNEIVFAQQIANEDITNITHILNHNFRLNTDSEWAFINQNQFFILKVSEQELNCFQSQALVRGINSQFGILRAKETPEIYIVCFRKQKETFFDLWTILNKAFPSPQVLMTESVTEPPYTYSSILHQLQPTPIKITEEVVASQFSAVQTQLTVEKFVLSISHELEKIIEDRINANLSENNNVSDVNNIQRSLISELYKNLLSGKCNKENFSTVNSHLSAFKLSDDLIAKIQLCIDIKNNSKLIPEHPTYESIRKLFGNNLIQDTVINYEDFKDRLIKRLEQELKAFTLSEEELMQELEKECTFQ